MAAAYCNERSVDAFRSRVGSVYPYPTPFAGRFDVWTKTSLDKAIEKLEGTADRDPLSLADDL